jgi:hypothetical protein
VKIANAYSTFPSSDRAPRPAEARRGYPRRPPPPQAAYGGRLIFAPGSSLGGARPKASVVDQHGHLSIAKFPKETDDYSMETWEEISLRLAGQACIATPQHELVEVAGKSVMLSRRFDRDGAIRIPFLSAMAMMGARDGERASYPEIVDALAQHGAQGKTDAHALYRRVAFNVLISNVDDHLRNHGFLWLGKAGWSLSPAYDLNPAPTDLKARVLTTNIDLDEGTCSLDLLEQASEYFALTLAHARAIIKEVATVTATWRETAKAVGARSAEITAWPAPSSMTISRGRWRYDRDLLSELRSASREPGLRGHRRSGRARWCRRKGRGDPMSKTFIAIGGPQATQRPMRPVLSWFRKSRPSGETMRAASSAKSTRSKTARKLRRC